MLNSFGTRSLIVIIILSCVLLLSNCAGPLDKATRHALDSSFLGREYLAKVYLGNLYNLVYTNNSVDGRSPTGVFINQSLNYWYETDASFFGAGSSGHEYTLEQLQEIDRDLDFDTFGQGIVPGQLVVIKEISDKSDQLIFEVKTASRYKVDKKYGVSTRSKAKSRESRIHCIFGKEGMQDLNQTILDQMLDQLLAPVPSFTTNAQKTAFILSNYPATPVDDLVKITGVTGENILKTYYAHILSQSQFTPNLQGKLVDVLVTNHDAWYQDSGIRLQDISLGESSLNIDCAIQEISTSVIYHSPELRAGLLFFDGVTHLARAFGKAFAAIPGEDFDSPFQKLLVKFSYLYFDGQGWRFPENITYTLAVRDLRQFGELGINPQELADRSEILMGTTPVTISLSALEAVANVKPTGPTTWKIVQVELEDWGYEESEDEDVMIIEGRVRNTGTWIAEDVEVTVEGYSKYGFAVRSESTILSGPLKPGETESFSIKISTEDIKRFSKPSLKWKEVE